MRRKGRSTGSAVAGWGVGMDVKGGRYSKR